MFDVALYFVLYSIRDKNDDVYGGRHYYIP